MRTGRGNHNNSKKERGFGAGAATDLVRAAQQSSHRSSLRADAPHRLDLSGAATRATMPVCGDQRRDPMRADSRGSVTTCLRRGVHAGGLANEMGVRALGNVKWETRGGGE